MDVLHPQIDKSLSLLIYKTTDVLCGFILHFYFNYAHHANQRLIYQDCDNFNEWFDDENPLEVGGVHLSASEALYNLDYQAYIDIYDMTQTVNDGATCPVYYESRVINLNLDDATLQALDDEYELLAEEGTTTEQIDKSNKEVSHLEEILGSPANIDSLCQDILKHYEENR